MLQDIVKAKERNREVQRHAGGGSHEPERARADRLHNTAARLSEAGPDRDAANLQTAEPLDDRALQHGLRDFLRLIDQQTRDQKPWDNQ